MSGNELGVSGSGSSSVTGVSGGGGPTGFNNNTINSIGIIKSTNSNSGRGNPQKKTNAQTPGFVTLNMCGTKAKISQSQSCNASKQHQQQQQQQQLATTLLPPVATVSSTNESSANNLTTDHQQQHANSSSSNSNKFSNNNNNSVLKIGITASGTNVVSNGLTATTGLTTSSTLSSVTSCVSGTPTAIRTLNASGQSTPVRLVMPPGLMAPTVFKQLDCTTSGGVSTSTGTAGGGGGARTSQITAIQTGSGGHSTRALGQSTSLTVARPLTQTTYLPRASVSASQMTAVGQRLLTPIRATITNNTPVTVAGGFVRTPTGVPRHTTSPGGALTQPTNATWMTANTSGGQVQLIRAIPQQTRQRLMSTSGLATVTTSQSNVSSAANPLSSTQAAQSAYVATMATVLPPRSHTGTLVYSSNMSNNPVPSLTPTSAAIGAVQQSFNVSSTPGTRIAVASSGTGHSGNASAATARQIRPIPLGKSFATTKLNTTSISLRTPNMPHLTPALSSVSNVSLGAHMSRNSISTAGAGTANLSAPNLSAARIIQLQQQQQGGAAGRLTGNVMLQPIIVGAGKLAGFRPPVTMAGKVQPSLTITHVAPGKFSSGTSTSGTSTSSTSHNLVNSSTNTTNAHLSGFSGNFVPVALATRSASMAIAGSGNIYAGNLTPISLNKAFMNAATPNSSAEHHGMTAAERSSNIFLHNASSLNLSTMPQRAPINVVTGLSAAAATTVINTTTATVTNLSLDLAKSTKMSAITPFTTTTTLTASSAATTVVAAVTNTTTCTITTPSYSASSSTGTVGAVTSAMPPGVFLPSSSTIYYESVNSIASSGVLSINPNNNSNISTTAQQPKPSTFTVVSTASVAQSSTSATSVTNNFSGIRTLAQLHLPTAAGTTAVPVRLASTTAAHLHHANNNSNNIVTAVPATSTALIDKYNNVNNNTNSTSNMTANATVLQLQQSSVHSIIPLPKMTGSGSTTSVVTNFLRKRETEGGNTVRAAKNLAPTLIAMGSNNNSGSSGNSTRDSNFLKDNAASSSHTFAAICGSRADDNNSPALAGKLMLSGGTAIESFPKNEKNLMSSRCDSPLSSDGSTTVSANSSPGVDQMESSMVFNRINELYDNYPTTSSSHLSGNNLNSCMLDNHTNQHHHNHQANSQHTHVPRQNGPNSDLARKKFRRSTSGQSLIGSGTNNSLASTDSPINTGNGHTYSISSSSSSNSNSGMYNGGGSDVESVQNGSIYNKENTQPIHYVIKKPRMSIMNDYKIVNKLPYNHFLKPADVKPRDQPPPTIQELANDPKIYENISGWKIYYVGAQFDNLVDSEYENHERLSQLLSKFEKSVSEGDKDFEPLFDLVKGTMQRTQIVVDNLREAKYQMERILDHKPRVEAIIQKYASKRNTKRREKS